MGQTVVVFRVVKFSFCCWNALGVILVPLGLSTRNTSTVLPVRGVLGVLWGLLECFRGLLLGQTVVVFRVVKFCLDVFRSFAVVFAFELLLILLKAPKRGTPLQFGLEGVPLGCFGVSWGVLEGKSVKRIKITLAKCVKAEFMLL